MSGARPPPTQLQPSGARVFRYPVSRGSSRSRRHVWCRCSGGSGAPRALAQVLWALNNGHWDPEFERPGHWEPGTEHSTQSA